MARRHKTSASVSPCSNPRSSRMDLRCGALSYTTAKARDALAFAHLGRSRGRCLVFFRGSAPDVHRGDAGRYAGGARMCRRCRNRPTGSCHVQRCQRNPNRTSAESRHSKKIFRLQPGPALASGVSFSQSISKVTSLRDIESGQCSCITTWDSLNCDLGSIEAGNTVSVELELRTKRFGMLWVNGQ